MYQKVFNKVQCDVIDCHCVMKAQSLHEVFLNILKEFPNACLNNVPDISTILNKALQHFGDELGTVTHSFKSGTIIFDAKTLDSEIAVLLVKKGFTDICLSNSAN